MMDKCGRMDVLLWLHQIKMLCVFRRIARIEFITINKAIS